MGQREHRGAESARFQGTFYGNFPISARTFPKAVRPNTFRCGQAVTLPLHFAIDPGFYSASGFNCCAVNFEKSTAQQLSPIIDWGHQVKR